MIEKYYQETNGLDLKNRVFIIAEVGINHNGSVETAKKMIQEAKKCGVDAVKFQTFNAEEFISDHLQTYTYMSEGAEVTESMLEMFKRYEFNKNQWREIIEYCRMSKVQFLTTPQNHSDLQMILEIEDIPIIKVGSDDLTNLPLMKKYATYNKPMIISAGMAYLEEIRDAVNCILEAGNKEIVVLHCISSYPAELKQVNMNKMLTIQKELGVSVGFSDHTQGIQSAIIATALGAKVIEKHFTLDKKMSGPDHWFSCDVKELNELVTAIRSTELILGSQKVEPTEQEIEMRSIARRSIVVAKHIKQGERITEDMLDLKRPGTGLSPKEIYNVLGCKARIDIKKGKVLRIEEIE